MAPARPTRPRVSLERALSKLGFASRTEARALIGQGRVQVNGTVVTDPLLRVDPGRARIVVNGAPVRAAERVYVALHKPRGLVTTRRDEHGRDTVYDCFHNSGLPSLVPVGRLDRESEGLLLFTNDTRWAQRVLDPATHVPRRYEVHVAGTLLPGLPAELRAGVHTRSGEVLRAVEARIVRTTADGAVLELTLEEGRNRQVRRMLEAHGLTVTRLLRRAIGPIRLGDLEPARWRHLTDDELAAFGTLAPTPRKVKREAQTPKEGAAGKPSKGKREPQRAAGKPSKGKREPQRAAGEPSKGARKPQRAADKPGKGASKPKPQRAPRKPTKGTRKPGGSGRPAGRPGSRDRGRP